MIGLEIRLLDQLVVAAGFAVLILIGWRSSRSSQTDEGYFLAGRSMPGWVIGFSLMATIVSSVTFLALPAFAYGEGNWRNFVVPFRLHSRHHDCGPPVHSNVPVDQGQLGLRVPGTAVRALGQDVCRRHLCPVSFRPHGDGALRGLSGHPVDLADGRGLGAGHYRGGGSAGVDLHRGRRLEGRDLDRCLSGHRPDRRRSALPAHHPVTDSRRFLRVDSGGCRRQQVLPGRSRVDPAGEDPLGLSVCRVHDPDAPDGYRSDQRAAVCRRGQRQGGCPGGGGSVAGCRCRPGATTCF